MVPVDALKIKIAGAQYMGTAQVQAGVVIAYRLRPSDRPTNPERLCHGIVTEVYTRACWVRLNEPGYEGLDEMIFFEQIVGIEGGPSYGLSTR
jgi:hypothetical protein